MNEDDRHPLPASEEARSDKLPEQLREGKGLGDDDAARIQPAERPAAPDGGPYGKSAESP